MQTSRWDRFLLQYLLHTSLFLIPFLVVSFLFSAGFNYMGGDTSSLFLTILKSQPITVFSALAKILLVAFSICLGLQILCSGFHIKFKLSFGFIFFLCAILRVTATYPAIAENWILVQHFGFIRNAVQAISTLPETSTIRLGIQWSPFLVAIPLFFINFLIHMHSMIQQNKMIKNAQTSIHIDDLDRASRIFSIQGVSFLIFIVLGGFFLFQLTSFFSFSLPQNRLKSERPNVFIFAIDSLRYDRLASEKFSNVMPFLKSKLPQATLFEPMLVGVPRTFPSWTEIAMGQYSLHTSVRNMFPSRHVRMGKKQTVFQAAKDQGYTTLFISDFAGDIFPRYPFGSNLIDAPTSDLVALIENGFITSLSALQSVLVLPNLQGILPSLLESPEIADPRLVAKRIKENLSLASQSNHPIFLTSFFSSAHFPYAAPGPWYAQFQQKDSEGHYMFRKIPDQIIYEQKKSLQTNGKTDFFSAQIPLMTQQQTIALYDGGLSAIDQTLKNLFEDLEKKGWLKNSLILIFGDHGENLYDGNLGMGHGDGVQGEYSNVTPLIVFANGTAKTDHFDQEQPELVRSIDIAPTIAKRIHIVMDKNQFEGRPLLDKSTQETKFPTDRAYMESGIWFVSDKRTPEGKPRVVYPNVAALLDIDMGMNFEFYTRSLYAQTVTGVKERAWLTTHYRLVARTTPSGVKLSLYSRDDTQAKYDLLKQSAQKKKYQSIAQDLLKQMNGYLVSCGVEIISNKTDSFFYSENMPQ